MIDDEWKHDQLTSNERYVGGCLADASLQASSCASLAEQPQSERRKSQISEQPHPERERRRSQAWLVLHAEIRKSQPTTHIFGGKHRCH